MAKKGKKEEVNASLSIEDKETIEKCGFQFGKNGEVVLRNFSLKLEFDGKLDTQVLKDAAIGLDSTVNSAACVYSRILGEDVRIARSELKTVKAGSCDFQGISLVIENTNELIKTLKDMDMQHLFVICTSGIILYTIHRVFTYMEKHDIANLAREKKETTQNVQIEELNVNIGENLKHQYPENEKEVELVTEAIEAMSKEQPRTLRNFAKGLTKLAHPGSAEVTRIVSTICKDGEEPQAHVLLNDEELKSIPSKMPKETKAEPTPELYQNVQIEVVKIDKESSSDNALQCRIVDENYSNKKCPFIIDDLKMREEVMQRFPKNINADLYALKKYNSKGEMTIVGYVLKCLR